MLTVTMTFSYKLSAYGNRILCHFMLCFVLWTLSASLTKLRTFASLSLKSLTRPWMSVDAKIPTQNPYDFVIFISVTLWRAVLLAASWIKRWERDMEIQCSGIWTNVLPRKVAEIVDEIVDNLDPLKSCRWWQLGLEVVGSCSKWLLQVTSPNY